MRIKPEDKEDWGKWYRGKLTIVATAKKTRPKIVICGHGYESIEDARRAAEVYPPTRYIVKIRRTTVADYYSHKKYVEKEDKKRLVGVMNGSKTISLRPLNQ